MLLIGGAGLVGRHLRRALIERAPTVTCHREQVEGCVALDITDRDATRRLIEELRPAVVIVAAADPYVERCEREPVPTRRVNLDGTRNIVEASQQVGARVVAFSSDYVFPGGRDDFTEDDEVKPLNEYGRQKVEVERLVVASGGLVCRLSGVYGWEPRRKNFVLQLVDRGRAGQRLTVASDQTITPTYALSLAQAVVALVDRRVSGIVHVCGPRVLDRVEFAYAALDAFDLPRATVEARATRDLGLSAVRPLRCGLSDAKLRSLLGAGLTDHIDALSEMAAGEQH